MLKQLGSIVLALVILSSAALAGQQNLLKNPGFEDAANGMPSGWSVSNAKSPAVVSLDEENRLDGKYSLLITGDPNSRWLPVFSEVVPARPGDKFTLGGYFMTDLVMKDSPVVFAAMEISSTGETVTFHHVNVPAVRNWNFASTTFTLGDKARGIQVFLVLPNAAGRAWFDNIVLVSGDLEDTASYKERIADTQKNLAANGGFESTRNGLPSMWLVGNSKDVGVFSLDTSTVHNGKTSLKVTGDPSSKWSPIYSAPSVVKANERLTLKGWCRNETQSAGAGLLFAVLEIDGKGESIIFRETKLETKPGWNEYTKTFTTSPNAAYVEVFIVSRNCTGTAWFDDISLTRE